MNIDSLVAFVTGANKGIGFQIARQLGEQGATVIVGARDAARGGDAVTELQTAGIDAHTVTIDVIDDASIATAARTVRERWARVDILVNNAGIVGSVDASSLPTETTRDGLREIFETNVFGVVAVTNAFLGLLHESAHPRIVNISSEVASLTSMFNPQHPFFGINELGYPASKTALNMVTGMYAKQLSREGFRVNAAIPGWTATDFNNFQGPRSARDAASVAVTLATVDDDGPTGTFWGALAAENEANGFPGW